MRILPTPKGFSAPFKPYHAGPITRLEYHDPAHIPDSKRPGEVDSALRIRFDRNVKARWLTVMVEETTRHLDSHRTQTRSITTTIDQMADLVALRDFLNTLIMESPSND